MLVGSIFSFDRSDVKTSEAPLKSMTVSPLLLRMGCHVCCALAVPKLLNAMQMKSEIHEVFLLKVFIVNKLLNIKVGQLWLKAIRTGWWLPIVQYN